MKGTGRGGEALALLALLERLQSGTDATRQDDLFKGVKGKHRDAWDGGGGTDLTEEPITHRRCWRLSTDRHILCTPPPNMPVLLLS